MDAQTLNGGESALRCPDGCGFCMHGEVSCLCLEDHAECDNCTAPPHDGPCDPADFPIYTEADPDETLPALSTLTLDEINSALEPLDLI